MRKACIRKEELFSECSRGAHNGTGNSDDEDDLKGRTGTYVDRGNHGGF